MQPNYLPDVVVHTGQFVKLEQIAVKVICETEVVITVLVVVVNESRKRALRFAASLNPGSMITGRIIAGLGFC